jgi:glycosyltransferase involved in cell wall biosynthesis
LTRRASAPLLRAFASPKFAGLAEYGGSFGGAYLLRRALYMPWELGRFMDRAFIEEGWGRLDLLERLRASTGKIRNDRQRVAALELAWYLRNQLLRDADWAGMAHSVEIRVPLVDRKLFRSLAPLMLADGAPGKREAARALGRLLPEALLARGKTGFSIPVHEWAKATRIARGPQRPLRNWAHIVQRPYKRLRALAFLPDAFGGHGGIALYNRDLLTSVCAMDEVQEVVALPRLVGARMETLPAKLRYRLEAANGKLRYLCTAASILVRDGRFDVVLCGHVNLLPLAAVAKLRVRAPLLMFIYGIDAWRPQPAGKRLLLRSVDRFVSISDVTREKFTGWSAVGRDRITILPNAIHTDWYGPGGRDPALVARYGLHGKRVLMTLGRLVSSERYKGFDEVLDVLPALAQEMPDLVYLIVGDGTDRARLERKARDLGVHGIVRFTGLVPEAEKADHYRLADAYVMPSRGEGFGFVLLEAMACGVPTVASRLDGGREAVRDGMLGVLVDPCDLEDVKRGIREALRRGRGEPPSGLDFFSFDNFASRARRLVHEAARSPRLRRWAA